MKKIALLLTMISLIFVIFTACNKEQTISTDITTIAVEDQYLLNLAEKANSYEEILDILQKNKSDDFQVLLSKCNNKIVQEALLTYENLSSQALIYICENPNVRNIKHVGTENLFINAISKIELTPEEQIQIANTNRYVAQLGILQRDDLTVESLIYILKFNDKIIWTLNINHIQIQQIIYNQILKMEITVDEKKQLEELNIHIVDSALMDLESQV